MFSAKLQQDDERKGAPVSDGGAGRDDSSFKMTIDALIGGNGSDEWVLLQHLAWLDSEFIPEELLLEILGKANLIQVIENLERLLLIKTENKVEIRGIAITRQVQDQTKRYAKSNPQASKEIPQLLAVLLEVVGGLFKKATADWNRERVTAYAPIIEALFLHSANIKPPIPKNQDLALLYAKLAAFYWADPQKSVSYAEKAIAIYQAFYKGPHSDVAGFLYSLGYDYYLFGDYAKTITYLKRCIKIKQALYQGNHHDIADSLNNVGFTYWKLGDGEQSLNYYEQVLKMRQALYPNNHPDVADSLNTVGRAHDSLGHIKQSLDYFMQALKMRKALYPWNHCDTAMSLYNIGVAYCKLGNNKQMLNYYEEALKMRQALYPDNHPDVANSLNSVGLAYANLGNIQQALFYYEQALKMEKALYPGNHRSTALSLYNIGVAYWKLGDDKKRLYYYEQALKMRQALYPYNHHDVADLLNDVGIAYENLGDIQRALNYYEQALKMRRALYPDNHPSVANSLYNVGNAYLDLKKNQKGLGYHKQALKMRNALYQNDHHEVANSLNNVGTAHGELGNNQDSLFYFKKALKMRQKLYPDNHPDVAESLNNVGSAYAKLGELNKSLSYYERALSMMKALYPGNHHHVADSLNNVGNAYRRLRNLEQSLDYFMQALEMRKALYPGNHRAVAESLSNIGSIYRSLGDHKNNLLYTKQALEMMQALSPDDHPYVVALRYDVGIAESLQDGGEEFKGQGTAGDIVDSSFEYYNSGIDQILKLRIVNPKVRLLEAQYSTKQLNFAAERLVNDVSSALLSDQAQAVLVPFNLHNEHWLGLAFMYTGGVVKVTYMDSEQGAMALELKYGLERGLSKNGYQTQFSEARLERQRYSNCGPELIENFAYHLTGTRATQEAAVYVHSLLVENNLLDPKEYGLKIAENNKLIGFLSNTAPLPIRSMEAFPIAQRPLPHASSQRKLGSSPFSSESRRKPSSGLTRGSSPQYQISMCEDGSSGQARRKGLDPSFRWDDAGGGVDAIDLNLLPAIEQFNRLWAKWLQDKLHQVNAVVHKTTMGFKGLDLAVDSARLLYKPDLENAKSVALDASYLYSMYSGVNGYSALVSGAEIAYQLHSGEYHSAFNTGAATLSAMALPYILAMCNRPYLGFAYGILVAASTAYTAALNAYSFVLELKEKDANLKSTVAYKELVEWLAASSLQTLYDFEACATEYKLQINDLLFEKAIVKAKTQGEFEQEAEALMAKHHSQSYEHCVEVRSEDVKPSSEYDCYNMSGHGELLI
jgi:tetratricopeptide (TPR) repeat protein